MNPFVLVVGILQFVAAGYSFWYGDWKMGVVNVGVAVANSTFAFMAKG